MSMEDILKALVDSRQQGTTQNTADPMTDLIGGLLGGQSQGGVNLSDGVDAGDVAGLLGGFLNASQQQSQGANPQQPQAAGVSGMMGMLEAVMGGGQGGSQSAANDPVMLLLQPFIEPLAKKAKISPELAMIVVSFVAHKLLAHHPASGRDSNSFNFEEVFDQMGSGKIDSSILENSGMIEELSKKTGLDEATAAKSLDMAFAMVGKGASNLIDKNAKNQQPSLPPLVRLNRLALKAAQVQRRNR
ncbi:MAG: hypothetical protein IPL71_22490 [Anaerolineales bacterium]|uniref:hypothetical protein n=1 Tax=Candidatus Villigracilis proximus TaxID=3140683 RepID=UPI003136DE8D|nr:hypothetical protein [Anaerolineales bacterium]